MRFWRSAPRQRTSPSHASAHEIIENRLLAGEEIPLHLAPELTARVSMDGVSLFITTEQPMSEDQARALLLTARYAATYPDTTPVAQTGEPDPDDVRTIPVRLNAEQNEYVGDVLAAYFRLNPQD